MCSLIIKHTYYSLYYGLWIYLLDISIFYPLSISIIFFTERVGNIIYLYLYNTYTVILYTSFIYLIFTNDNARLVLTSL